MFTDNSQILPGGPHARKRLISIIGCIFTPDSQIQECKTTYKPLVSRAFLRPILICREVHVHTRVLLGVFLRQVLIILRVHVHTRFVSSAFLRLILKCLQVPVHTRFVSSAFLRLILKCLQVHVH